MGMFDYVAFEYPCPMCKTVIKEFQSKSGACCMYTVLPHTVYEFYAWCPNCKQEVVFEGGKLVKPGWEGLEEV